MKKLLIPLVLVSLVLFPSWKELIATDDMKGMLGLLGDILS